MPIAPWLFPFPLSARIYVAGIRPWQDGAVHLALGLVLLVAASTAIAAGARRLSLSEPLVLTVAGIAGSYLWFIPDVALSPELVLLGLLPPLLYTTAIRTSLLDFKANRRAIGL